MIKWSYSCLNSFHQSLVTLCTRFPWPLSFISVLFCDNYKCKYKHINTNTWKYVWVGRWGSWLAYSTDTYFHILIFVFVSVFHYKYQSYKYERNTAGKSAKINLPSHLNCAQVQIVFYANKELSKKVNKKRFFINVLPPSLFVTSLGIFCCSHNSKNNVLVSL